MNCPYELNSKQEKRTRLRVKSAVTLRSKALIQSYQVRDDVSRNFVHFLDLHNLGNAIDSRNKLLEAIK